MRSINNALRERDLQPAGENVQVPVRRAEEGERMSIEKGEPDRPSKRRRDSDSIPPQAGDHGQRYRTGLPRGIR